MIDLRALAKTGTQETADAGMGYTWNA